MTQLPSAAFEPIAPADISYLWVDDASGMLTDEGCPNARLIPFIKGSEPVEFAGCGLQSPVRRAQSWFSRLFGD